MEVIALIVPTFIFVDVTVVVLPARGIDLRRVLGFTTDRFKLDPAHLGVGSGRCRDLVLVTTFAIAAFGVTIVDDDGPLLGQVLCLVQILHDALDHGTKCEGGILELFDTDPTSQRSWTPSGATSEDGLLPLWFEKQGRMR